MTVSSTTTKTKIISLLVATLYVSLVFLLSSIPGKPNYQVPYNLDKLVHIIEYAVLGALIGYVLRSWGVKGFVLKSVIITSIIGLCDEIYQSYTPFRDSSMLDALADSIGATVGAMLYQKITKVKSQI